MTMTPEEWRRLVIETVSASGKPRKWWAEKLAGAPGFPGELIAYGYLTKLHQRPLKRYPDPDKWNSIGRIILGGLPELSHHLMQQGIPNYRPVGGSWKYGGIKELLHESPGEYEVKSDGDEIIRVQIADAPGGRVLKMANKKR